MKYVEQQAEMIDTTLEAILNKNQPLITSVGRGGERKEFFETIPFLPDESGDGCLPRHEPQAGGLAGSGDRVAEKPLLQRLAGHRGSVYDERDMIVF